MKDQDLIIKAIENYDAYTPMQREVLKTLVGISVNDIAIITPLKLTKLLKTTRATIYYSLKRLKTDEVITNVNEKNERFNKYRLNSVKLSDILTVHRKKLEFFKNNI